MDLLLNIMFKKRNGLDDEWLPTSAGCPTHGGHFIFKGQTENN